MDIKVVIDIIIDIIIGATLSIIIAIDYVGFLNRDSGSIAVAKILPLMTIVTIVIISVITTSPSQAALPVSLGLLGAMSIVRFRTPIKDPKGLSYLFMSIAVGLGLGANQRVPTFFSFITILAILNLVERFPIFKEQKQPNFSLNLTIEISDNCSIEIILSNLQSILLDYNQFCQIKQLDIDHQSLQVEYQIHKVNDENIISLIGRLKDEFPKAKLKMKR